MKNQPQEYQNPNKPFRFFQTFKRPWGPDYTYPDFVSMPTEGLRQLALALFNDPLTGPIFKKAGIHGDIGAGEEQLISDFVEGYVAQHVWEKPDPSNLVVSTVLARQLAEYGIGHDDVISQTAFIENKRCDGLDLQPDKNAKKQYKLLKASEVVLILQWLDRQDDLKAPWTALRSKTFKRGQSFFASEDEGRWHSISMSGTAGQIAVHKYGLGNRSLIAIGSLISDLNSMYAVKEVDGYDDARAFNWMTQSYHNKYIINDVDSGEGA